MGEKEEEQVTLERINQMRKNFEKKIEKIKSIGMDYVEELLEKETEMEVDVLNYLLVDLLPLKEIHLNPKKIIASAIRTKNLPFRLEGDTYKRYAGEVKAAVMEEPRSEEIEFKRQFSPIMEELKGCLEQESAVSFAEFKSCLASKGILLPRGKNLELTIEKAIAQGLFNGYMDLVEKSIHRPKNENELYQSKFEKELAKFKEKVDDELDEIEIPQDLELLLLSPDEPRSISGFLERTESVINDIEASLLSHVRSGAPTSITGLKDLLIKDIRDKHDDLSYRLDVGEIEHCLECMIKEGKIQGYFQDDDHFLRIK